MLVSLALLAACHNEGTLELQVPDVTLTVETPTYGEFLGAGPAMVTGRVTPSSALLTIEGETVSVGEDGRFEAPVDLDHAYRIVDVEASLGDQWERVRVPVFRGHDPVPGFPGGVTLRLTPAGLAELGVGLGATIDATGWDQQIADALPQVGSSALGLTPVGVTHDPTVVELRPAVGGIDAEIVLREVDVVYDLTYDFGSGFAGALPVTVGYDRIGVGTRAVPEVDVDGLLFLTLTDASVNLGDPDITILGLDGWLLETLVSAVGDLIAPIGELLLDTALGQFGVIELGGPYVFETDLLGTQVEIRLSDVFGDLDGVGAGLGMGLDEPAAIGPLAMPVPRDDRPDVHAEAGLHEGLLQIALTSGLIDTLTQEIALPGTFGTVIGAAMENLPGGDDAPEGEGWCLSMTPMPARVARLQSGLDPFAVFYLPDVVIDIGVMDGSVCESWLVASLAFEIGLDVRDGTLIKMDPQIPEGAVLEYGAEAGWEEAEVVAGLSDFMGTAMELLGGQFSYDLADLMGGGAPGGLVGFGDVEPRIVDSQPLLDANDVQVEGLYEVSLSLWPPAAP